MSNNHYTSQFQYIQTLPGSAGAFFTDLDMQISEDIMLNNDCWAIISL